MPDKSLERAWFGFLTFFVAISLFVHPPGEAGTVFVVGPMGMMAFGYFLFKRLVWDLADYASTR